MDNTLSLEALSASLVSLDEEQLRTVCALAARIFSHGIERLLPSNIWEFVRKRDAELEEAIRNNEWPKADGLDWVSFNSESASQSLFVFWSDIVATACQIKLTKDEVADTLFRYLNVFQSLQFFEAIDYHEFEWDEFVLKVKDEPWAIEYSRFVFDMIYAIKSEDALLRMRELENRLDKLWSEDLDGIFI